MGIDMEVLLKENKTRIWRGTYMGVDFEINNFKMGGVLDFPERDCWAHYMYIKLDRVPNKEIRKSFWLKPSKDTSFGRKWYNYFKSDWCGRIEFHGGCTWYSKESGLDGFEKIVKIGCDYQHSWDEGKYYDVDYVKAQVLKTIESFWIYVGNYKYRCRGNGNLYNSDEGRIDKNGSFHSYQYWSDKPLWENLYVPHSINQIESK